VLSFLATFVSSALVTLWLVYVCRRWPGAAMDDKLDDPQKVHRVPAPRIGGIGIVMGLLIGTALVWGFAHTGSVLMMMLMLACAMPAFMSGVIHDFTDRLQPRGRLLATAISAVLAYAVLDAQVTRSDIPGLDLLLATGLGSLFVTALAVAGIANAINIIDGLNGLAAMCVLIMLAGVAYVAGEVGDELVLGMALAGIGAVLGFFIWNYPSGLIFLGDGGAYFLGFYVAELCILLLARNPGVSGLFALLVCIYPIVETVFSAWRRFWLRSRPATLPDGIHLHTLVYRRLVRWAVGEQDHRAVVRANSMSSPYLWLLCSASVAPAMLFWDNPPMLGAMIVLFAVSYVVLYRQIVRFRSPRWLRRATRSADVKRSDGDAGDNQDS
jgi:UDP-N-acetylmuramyl pentapeptide phosphotransferase/UDP-N-acetylglucosamine-1-phosphate transferase